MRNTFYSQGNPYSIVRTTGTTYTASVGELIVADETEVTLPSGVDAGSVIAVRAASPSVSPDVVGANGSVDGFSAGTTHQEPKVGEYIYDGSNWYLRNEIEVRDNAIPDSVVIQQHNLDANIGSGDTAGLETSDYPVLAEATENGNVIEGIVLYWDIYQGQQDKSGDPDYQLESNGTTDENGETYFNEWSDVLDGTDYVTHIYATDDGSIVAEDEIAWASAGGGGPVID